MPKPSPSSQVPAATRALAVLRVLAQAPGPVPAAVLARELALPRSTVYHLLTAMAAEGFVTHLPEERRYGLGVAAFEIGSAYSRQEPLQRLARPLLARLVDSVGQSAHLAVLHGREVLYVVEERAPGRPPLVTDVGVRLPAQLTASGRAMLAVLPPAQVRALFPHATAFVQRQAPPAQGPTSPAQLRRLLMQVRRDGFAQETGEISLGFSSVAAVVRDHTGYPAAAVTVTFDPSRLPDTGSMPQSQGRPVGAASSPVSGGSADPAGAGSRTTVPRTITAAVQATAAAIERRLSGRARPPGRTSSA